MAKQSRKGFDRAGAAAGARPASGKAAGPKPASVRSSGSGGRSRMLPAIVGGIIVVAIALGGLFLATRGGSGSPDSANAGTVIQASNGSWTNISPDRLASELKQQHDFTLLNVKTPYIGEIDGTDLYIPYTQLAARASELPTNKAAKIIVYCRSGAESAIASQTLLNLGYTNIENLDGGMNAWTTSGRSLVQKNRI